MAKKKGKKSQKHVETAPPDSAPAAEEPIPEEPEVTSTAEAPFPEPEAQPPTEIPAAEVTSGEKSVPSLPEVEITEGTVAAPAELSTSTPAHSPHLDNSEPILSDTTQLPATEIASTFERDPTNREKEEIEPQAISTGVTESQEIEQNPGGPQATATASGIEQPVTIESTEAFAAVTAIPGLEQEQHLTIEEEQSVPASVLDSKLETAGEPETVTPEPPVVSIEDAQHPPTLVGARELEVDTDAPSHNGLSPADDLLTSERPMDIGADEEREEPHKEEAEEISITPEAPSAPLQDPEEEVEQPLATGPSTAVSEELLPSAPEAPLAQPESTTEAQRLADAVDEKRRRKAARLERYRIEQDRLDEQELEQKRLENEAKQAVERAQEAETKELERLEQETAERNRLEEEELEKQRLEQEADARQLLESMGEERRATEAHEAAEQARETEVKADEQRKELESKAEQERLDTEKAEQEAMARQLLKQMELERRAEAEEAARAAEQARQEAEAEEEEQRAELERLEVNAREAAEFADKTQREAEEAEVVRIAAEQALDEPISHPTGNEPFQALANPVPQRDPVLESARVPIPRSAASSPHDRPASATSDRPSRSHRSPAPHVPKLRMQEAGPHYAPKPQAVSQLIEDNRPPAPSPPMGKARPRYAYAQYSFVDYSSAFLRRS
jgi:serine/arginine repetitive matrix protein 2